MPANRREDLRWFLRGLARRLGGDAEQREELAAYRGLVHQAFQSEPFAPRVCADVWDRGSFRDSGDLPAFHSPPRREREKSSHHYGHDVLLKRQAGLPLIGAPLPLLLEHGLKVARESTFERPRPWARAFLCMGPLRARWVRERFDLPAIPIGPWIAYARPLLPPERLRSLRERLGSTLLVVLAHSWDAVERRMDLVACRDAIEAIRRRAGYRSVIWLRHWKDPDWPGRPPDWLVACNGHRSNPWFLDSLRTLMELCDGLASNAFGTHLGYGVSLGLRLHWIDAAPRQDLSRLRPEQEGPEVLEWTERQRLSGELAALLSGSADSGGGVDANPIRALLDPYWGFGCVRTSAALRPILRGRPPAA